MASRSLREVARLVLLDANGSILLVRYRDERPGRPSSYWAAPGGALEQSETHRAAAARELREETGLNADIGAELWQRSFDVDMRSEEHTSELQSHSDLVCRLLLEKKKKKRKR